MQTTLSLWRWWHHPMMIPTMLSSTISPIVVGCRWITCSTRLYAPRSQQSGRRGAGLSSGKVRDRITVRVSIRLLL